MIQTFFKTFINKKFFLPTRVSSNSCLCACHLWSHLALSHTLHRLHNLPQVLLSHQRFIVSSFHAIYILFPPKISKIMSHTFLLCPPPLFSSCVRLFSVRCAWLRCTILPAFFGAGIVKLMMGSWMASWIFACVLVAGVGLSLDVVVFGWWWRRYLIFGHFVFSSWLCFVVLGCVLMGV